MSAAAASAYLHKAFAHHTPQPLAEASTVANGVQQPLRQPHGLQPLKQSPAHRHLPATAATSAAPTAISAAAAFNPWTPHASPSPPIATDKSSSTPRSTPASLPPLTAAAEDDPDAKVFKNDRVFKIRALEAFIAPPHEPELLSFRKGQAF
ncbi:hypothetical protein HK405_001617 [Cladochytrium tenue]|nr:hypothetical protein HK405_001617 [Cladochytrium tenue]